MLNNFLDLFPPNTHWPLCLCHISRSTQILRYASRQKIQKIHKLSIVSPQFILFPSVMDYCAVPKKLQKLLLLFFLKHIFRGLDILYNISAHSWCPVHKAFFILQLCPAATPGALYSQNLQELGSYIQSVKNM